MSMPPITGGFYKNSVKMGDVLTASWMDATEIRQMGQSAVLKKRDRYKITIKGTFVFGMHMAGAPEDIYEVDSDVERLRIFVESAKPIGGETEIFIAFDR
jgi:hypothetical protein